LVTGSPLTLTAGSNTIITTGSTGTFTINIYETFTLTLQSGISGTVASSGATVVGSPVSLVQGTNTIMTSTVGTFTVTLNETKNIVTKSGDFSVLIDPTTSGTIDATLAALNWSQLSASGAAGILNNGVETRAGEKFTAFPANATINSMQFYLYEGGSPTGTITCNVRNANTDAVIGTLGTMSASSLTASQVWYTFNTTPVNIGSVTSIRIDVEWPGSGSNAYVYVSGNSVANANANTALSTYTSGSWTDNTSGECGWQSLTTSAITFSVSGISSGIHTVTFSYSSGTASLQVDSLTPTTEGYVGALAVNTNALYIDQNNVMPYITSYSETVGGVQKVLYQPAAIISGVCLPDIDSSEAATMTFGSNSGGVIITLSSLAPTTPAQATTGNNYAIQSPGSILSSTLGLPPQMYTELDASLIPFGGAINAILAAGNVPQALWWMPFIYIFICIVGMLVYEATGPKGAPQVGSLLAMCVAIEILLVLFAVLGTVGVSGMIPLWSAILFIFPAAALIFSRRHVGWG
jgi:hypothetical protein